MPRENQEQIVAVYRKIADNPRVPKREREAGYERTDALERFMGLANTRKRK